MRPRVVLGVAAMAWACGAVAEDRDVGVDPTAQTGHAPGAAGDRRLATRRAGGSDLFPVKAHPLRAGTPSTLRVRGLPHPIFAIGPDEESLMWLAANAARLRAEHARGVLVSAASAGVLRRTRALAERFGLGLELVPGAVLASAFGATTYPFLAEPAE